MITGSVVLDRMDVVGTRLCNKLFISFLEMSAVQLSAIVHRSLEPNDSEKGIVLDALNDIDANGDILVAVSSNEDIASTSSRSDEEEVEIIIAKTR